MSASVDGMTTPAASAQSLQWAEVRKIVLARDGQACVSCGATPGASELDVHHVVPRAAGGVDDPANLITLCDGCHAARHPNLQASLARRMIERWGLRLAHWLDREGAVKPLDESLGAALRMMGVERFRSPQLEVILAAMRGESLLFVSATGSGKSLCFQLPILLAPGTGVVISPLKALMSQQVEGLTQKQIPGTFINGDLGPQEKRLRYLLLRKRAVKFLFCTPERFDAGMVRPAEVEELKRLRPSYLVVDEAHCIDRWGMDFRPNYDQLAKVRAMLGNPPVLAFTATAGAESQRRILESLGVPNARVIITGVNRPNIALARLPRIKPDDRFAIVADLLARMPAGRAMIFVPTIKVGKEVQEGLKRAGRAVPFYHARMGTANERDMLLGQFTGRLSPAENVIICTNAFGMGLDVPDVRLVVHWQHPASMEDYLQEFGRAGRDGLPSVAVLFTDAKDEGLLKFMAEKTSRMAGNRAQESFDAKMRAINVMKRHAENLGACFRNAIMRYFGETVSARRLNLAERLVSWIYERRTKSFKTERCCDVCDGVTEGNVGRWAAAVWASTA